ncbi:MAG: methionine synthase, partial [Fischerella sp.]|nr:methionine synthase [Fischerella sp.]
MKPFGIYTLANDPVYDQLVALLNSIERNVSAEIP